MNSESQFEALRQVCRTQTTSKLLESLRKMDALEWPRGEEDRIAHALSMSTIIVELHRRYPGAGLDNIPNGFGYVERCALAAELAQIEQEADQ